MLQEGRVVCVPNNLHCESPPNQNLITPYVVGENETDRRPRVHSDSICTCIYTYTHTHRETHTYLLWRAEWTNWPGSGEDSHQLWQLERNSDTLDASELQLRLTLPVEHYLQSERWRLGENRLPFFYETSFLWGLHEQYLLVPMLLTKG